MDDVVAVLRLVCKEKVICVKDLLIGLWRTLR
ncbi:hypothetical protein MnTg02_01332 [bacterium MnTg02]|nr:hypothetical protein MnTg02_01332 [bacterium MnTg02]